MNKTVLVTGGTGYIGSHTVVALQKKGFKVIVVDNLCNSSINALDGIKKITGEKPLFYKIDIARDKNALHKLFIKHGDIENIIHFAALKSVPESVKKPLLYYYNNLNGMTNILENMKKFQIPNLVFSSSCTVYGQPDNLPVTEKSPLRKANCSYGNTKRICEEIIADYLIVNQNINAISLRYFNPIGAHPSVFIGELPTGIPDNLVPYITQTAIGKRDQLRIFGNDYNTKDGTCIRDYIDIMDLADAHLAGLYRMIENKQKYNCEIFNVGIGKGISVLEIVKTFEKANNLKLNYKITDRRPGDIEKIYADVSYANKELGWKAYRTLSESLHNAWKWEQYLQKN